MDVASDADGPPVLRVFQSKAETRAFYDKISSVYDLLAEHSEGPVRRLGIEKLAAREGEVALEIGCGTGHCLVDLARAVGASGHVHGVDLSLGMLARASSVVAEAGMSARVSLSCGDAEHLGLRSESVTRVFMSFTLELFDTPAIPRVLAECRRVLSPEGRLVVVGLSKEAPPGIALHAFEWTHRHFPNLLDCRPIYVRRAVEAAGFEVLETVVERMWVPVEIAVAAKESAPGGDALG